MLERANAKRVYVLATFTVELREKGLVLRPHIALRRPAHDERAILHRAQRRAHDRA